MKQIYLLFIIVFTLYTHKAFAQPANNNPCSATALTVNSACVNTSGTNVAATASAGVPAPGCANYSGGDVWFSIVVPASGDITITGDNNGGFTDGGAAVYSGACGSLGLIAGSCNDDGGPGLHPEINLTGQTPGATLYIRYWEYGNNATGTFNICVVDPNPAPTCFDGIQNQGETGVDCGGPCIAICPPPSCVDGVQNQGETAIDCGGPCPACPTIVQPSAACATETFNISGPVTFYDDGGDGGNLCNDGFANNFANADCETTTTICAPAGQTLLVNFNVFAMYNTNSAFDWMKIYEGAGTGGTVLFNNDAGGPDNAPNGGSGSGYGDCGDDTPPTGFCSNLSNCLTFEFHASGVINRAGWDASVSITTGPTCSLPITLTHFEGAPYSNYNLLEWTTSSEINNDYFIVEKSDNGIEFEYVETITGAGNSNDLINYSLQHKYPENIEYYRLKQVDFDGNYSYSKIIVINSGNGPEISIYPNPSKNDLFFDLNEGVNEKYTITYVSVLGRTIQESINITSEKKKYKASAFNNLSSGVYFVQILNENNQVLKSQKVIKE